MPLTRPWKSPGHFTYVLRPSSSPRSPRSCEKETQDRISETVSQELRAEWEARVEELKLS